MKSCYWLKIRLVARSLKITMENIGISGKERALDLTAGNSASGTAEGDRSGYTLTFFRRRGLPVST